MFDNLDQQIASTQGTRPTQAERVVHYLVVSVLSVIAFGGLILGIMLLEF